MADQIGTRIQEARGEAGFTQEQFAPMLGVSLRTLTRYEKGVSDISVEMLIKVAKLTSQPLAFFFDKAAA